MAFLRAVPNIIVAAPMDGLELRQMLYTAQLSKINSPFAIRYPRSVNPIKEWEQPYEEIEIGKARKIGDGDDIAILSIGSTGNDVKKALGRLVGVVAAEHWDMRFVSPIDEEVLHAVFKKFKKIVTVEDGILKGGFGSAVIEFMSDNNYSSEVVRLGIKDYFVEHGTREELIEECGFDSYGIEKAILGMLDK